MIVSTSLLNDVFGQQWSGPNNLTSYIYRNGRIKVGYGPLYLDWTYQYNWGGNADKWAGYVGFNAYRNNNATKDYYYGGNAYTNKAVFEGSNQGFRWLYRITSSADALNSHILGEQMKLSKEGNLFIGSSSTDETIRLRVYRKSIIDETDIAIGFTASTSTVGVHSTAYGYYNIAYGVYGIASTNTTSYGSVGVYGSNASTGNSRYAGYFNGDLAYTGSFFKVSDVRFKEDIRDIENALDRLVKIKPKEYRFKKIDGYTLPTGKQVGMIAQELEKEFPELIKHSKVLKNPNDNTTSNDNEEYLMVNYVDLIPYIIKGIQEQQILIDSLNNKINFLTTNLDGLKAPVDSSMPFIVTIFPNPVADIVTISVNLPTDYNEALITLRNSDGYFVFQESTTQNISAVTFNTSALSDGIYFITLSVSGTVWDVKRILVSH